MVMAKRHVLVGLGRRRGVNGSHCTRGRSGRGGCERSLGSSEALGRHLVGDSD